MIELSPGDALIVSIVTLFVGMFLTDRIAFLKRYYIPASVTGGLLCSAIVALVFVSTGTEINFDMRLRDILLLVFFSTIGLSARFNVLVAGGKSLAVLVIIAAVFLVLQNSVGVGLAVLLGSHPGYGLMAGSVSFAGGHGTAIAWGNEAAAAGLTGAAEIGIVFATFGLIAGGLIGGPLAKRLLVKHNISGPDAAAPGDIDDSASDKPATTMIDILTAILLLAICVELGDLVNRLLFAKGVLVPGFLTSLFSGIVLTNVLARSRIKFNMPLIERFGDVSLQIFLAMSLMSMKLWMLGGAVGPVMLVLLLQITVMTFFAVYIVFYFMGRDYDAVVIASGFAGMGLGATPVAIANMTAITGRFGPSPKALLIVPMVGAFFIDILNAVTIKAFIGIISKLFD